MSDLSERIAKLSVAKRALFEQLLLAKDPPRSKRSTIGTRKTDGEYAPSFAQERLWFLAQLDPGEPMRLLGYRPSSAERGRASSELESLFCTPGDETEPEPRQISSVVQAGSA